jgi:hypothetical protein
MQDLCACRGPRSVKRREQLKTSRRFLGVLTLDLCSSVQRPPQPASVDSTGRCERHSLSRFVLMCVACSVLMKASHS